MTIVNFGPAEVSFSIKPAFKGKKKKQIVIRKPSKLHYDPKSASERQKRHYVHMALVANSGRGIEGKAVYPATGETIPLIAIYIALLRLGRKGDAIGLMFSTYEELGEINAKGYMPLPNDKKSWDAIVKQSPKISAAGKSVVDKIIALPDPPKKLTKVEKLRAQRAKQTGKWITFLQEYADEIKKMAGKEYTIKDLDEASVGATIKTAKGLEAVPLTAMAAAGGGTAKGEKQKLLEDEDEAPISRFF